MSNADRSPAAAPRAPAPRHRPMRFGIDRVVVRAVDEAGDDGDDDGTPRRVHHLHSEPALAAHLPTLGEHLAHWAATVPGRTLFARRRPAADGGTGDWQHLRFGAALAGARRVGAALLARGLDAERPVLIVCDNDLDHALLALGCLLVGVPYCAVSPSYALAASDLGKLRHAMRVLTPGLVFAADGARHGAALRAVVPADCEIVLGAGAGFARDDGGALGEFARWLDHDHDHDHDHDDHEAQADAAVEAAARAVGPDSIAKFMFTSGSTLQPKAVVVTHRMWCANQQQLAQAMPVLAEDGLVLVDWLPWSHTFGGNHNFGLALCHGGTLYIDDGRPTPAGMAETLRNLREIAPTVYFNVPAGFEAIARALQHDDALRRTLLSRVRLFFYAAAGLPQPTLDALHRAQERELGCRIVMGAGLGMTESGPFALFVAEADARAGEVGVPCAGLEVRLVPVDGDTGHTGDSGETRKTELRLRGPNITPGYWRDPEATRRAFDAQGFLRTGDAVAWIDPSHPARGLRFDGRIAEDFKLATGVFVSVGPLRARIAAWGAPYIRDSVVTGLDRAEVGALLFPTPALHTLAALPPDAPLAAVLAVPAVQAMLQALADRLAQEAAGSAERVALLLVMHEPPSPDHGEITDKGSLNQRAVLRHRAALVEALHDGRAESTIRPKT